MLNFFKRLFVPNRVDATGFAIAIHWVVAILSVVVLPVLNRGVVGQAYGVEAVAVATWLAIAATIGWKANSKRRMFLLFVSSVASFGFVIVWSYLNADFIRAQASNSNFRQSPGTFDRDLLLYQSSWSLYWCILASIFVWAGNWVARKAISSVKNPFSWIGRKFGDDRTRMLVIATGILFFVSIIGRILPAVGLGIEIGSFEVESAFSFTSAIFGFVLIWAIVLFWFPRSFVFDGKPVQKVASMLLVIVASIPYFANLLQSFAASPEVLFEVLGGVVFVCSVIGVGGAEREVSPVSAVSERKAGTVPRAAIRPSLFSLPAVLLLVTALTIPWYLDLGILTMPMQNNISLTQRFEYALESAKVRWNSGGRITSYFDEFNRVVTWKVQFDGDTPLALLDTLQSSSGFSCVELCNLQPSIDLGSIGVGRAVKLTDCEINCSQLDSILTSASWMEINGEFSVVDDGNVVDVGSFSSISFRDTKPGAVAAFFGAAKCEKKMTYLILQTPVCNEDWPAIEEVAQSGQVILCGGWANDFVMPKQTRSLRRVHFQASGVKPGGKVIDKDILLNTDIDFGMTRNDDSELVWKLAMLRGTVDAYYITQNFDASNKPLAEYAKEIGMAYQLNADQSIAALYFPFGSGETEVASLTKLKVLSFDPLWLGDTGVGFRGDPTSLSYLKSLPSLSELYLDAGFIPEDLTFLEDLKSLKHLQIPSVVRKVTGPVGFDACQSLESVTFLGIPDNQSYREISKLKNLNRFVIVNVEEDPILSERYLEKLQEKLPGIEVKIVPVSETEFLIPDPFREYRNRVRKELRKDTSWLDKVLE